VLIATQGITVSLIGTPSFIQQFVQVVAANALLAGINFSGAANGIRYSANTNGTITTAGAGANYFPGSAAGSTALGGQYV
ncbi:hypothetical protein, partial [Acinetobacter baumannii]|uniref:hypothetical protein n=1 Tax=Acinetobacter baumannii TaxID=470 RepID=UPI0037C8BEE3